MCPLIVAGPLATAYVMLPVDSELASAEKLCPEVCDAMGENASAGTGAAITLKEVVVVTAL